MKKVMIIGAGAGQVPIIELAKRHGLFTLVVSPFGPYPGIGLGDKHICEDIYHIDELIRIGREEKIDYVISDQSDYAVPIVAHIASALGLPGNAPEVAETYSYKSRFRAFCEKNGIPCPKAVTVGADSFTDDAFDGMRIPFVVKPSDSQGSRGITKVDSLSCLKDAINYAAQYSRQGKVVVEEYFRGREVVCEGFIYKGEYRNVSFGDRVYFDIEGKFIPSETIFPSTLDEEYKKAIVKNEEKITSLLRPSFGIVHSEYLVADDGSFAVVESALRGGGVYIASHLIPFSCGVDLTELLMDAMLGDDEGVRKRLSSSSKGAAGYMCFYLKEGVVTSIRGAEEVSSIPGVEIAEIQNIHVGDRIPRFEHKGMRKGPFIMRALSLDELGSVVDRIRKTLQIDIDGRQGIVWI